MIPRDTAIENTACASTCYTQLIGSKSNGKIHTGPFDITRQQFNVLRILKGQSPEPISTKEIRERMIVSSADSSRLVDRLCDKGLVWKRPCPHDGRLIQVFIDKAGNHLLDNIDKQMFSLESVMGDISEKEALALNQLLNKSPVITKNLDHFRQTLSLFDS